MRQKIEVNIDRINRESLDSLFYKILFIFLIFLYLSFHACSQNLVENPSFENYNNLLSKDDNYYKLRTTAIDNWTIRGCVAEYCTCDNNYMSKRIINDDQCNTKYKPFDGCKMMGMGFETGDADIGLPCEDYIFSKLKQPLQIGKVYEVSAWFYFPKRQFEEDSILCKHVGFQLLRYDIKVEMWTLILNNNFVFKTIEYDKWIQLKFFIKPTCELNYIVLGYFKDDNWPQKFNYRKSYYFLDNVSVNESNDSFTFSEAKYYCKETTLEYSTDKKINNELVTNIYFEKDSFHLTEKSKQQIDTFYNRSKVNAQKKLVIQVSGYTDNIGREIENLVLSQKRSDNVKEFLSNKYKLNKLRIISNGLGVLKSEMNVTKSRKVEIKISELTFDQICYKAILNSIKYSNMDSANYFMNIWFNITNDNNKIITLFDNRLIPFQETKYWDKYSKLIHKSYEKYIQPEYAFLMDSLYFLDQKYRTLEVRIDNISGDKDNFEFEKIYQYQWDSLDKINSINLINLIDKFGYPITSNVGFRQSSAATLIIEHSNDITLINKYIKIIENNCKIGEYSWLVFCNIYDRLMLLRNLPQVYGTQYIVSKKDKHLYQIYNHIDIQEMNQNREILGLPKIRETDLEKVMYINITHLKFDK